MSLSWYHHTTVGEWLYVHTYWLLYNAWMDKQNVLYESNRHSLLFHLVTTFNATTFSTTTSSTTTSIGTTKTTMVVITTGLSIVYTPTIAVFFEVWASLPLQYRDHITLGFFKQWRFRMVLNHSEQYYNIIIMVCMISLFTT